MIVLWVDANIVHVTSCSDLFSLLTNSMTIHALQSGSCDAACKEKLFFDRERLGGRSSESLGTSAVTEDGIER